MTQFVKKTTILRAGGIIILLAAAFVLPLSPLIAVKAQAAPLVVATWKADSYVPEDFPGKALPTKDSVVTASIEVLDGGRFANLSETEIRWLLDNDEFISGIGKKTFQFQAGKESEDTHELRISLNYRGEELISFLTIPVASPETIIDFGAYRYQIKRGESRFRALPYFFNITDPRKDLEFIWDSGEQVADGGDENPDELIYEVSPDTPDGDIIDVSVSVKNIRKTLEFASDSLTLVVIK